MWDLATIIKINDEAVRNAKSRKAEDAWNRQCSINDTGEEIILHSATKRETRYLALGPGAGKFRVAWKQAITTEAKNQLVESYFN